MTLQYKFQLHQIIIMSIKFKFNLINIELSPLPKQN